MREAGPGSETTRRSWLDLGPAVAAAIAALVALAAARTLSLPFAAITSLALALFLCADGLLGWRARAVRPRLLPGVQLVGALAVWAIRWLWIASNPEDYGSFWLVAGELFGFALLVAAAESATESAVRPRSLWIDRLDLAGWMVFVLAVLPYLFGPVPPSDLMVVLFALWSLQRFAYALPGSSRRSRGLFSLLIVATMSLLGSQLVQMVGEQSPAALLSARVLAAIGYLLLGWCARSLLAQDPKPTVPDPVTDPWWRGLGGPVVYALALPLVHLAQVTFGGEELQPREGRGLIGYLALLITVALVRELLVHAERRQLFDEQIDARARLARQEEQSRRLIESLSEAILIEQNGELVYLNSAALSWLGAEHLAELSSEAKGRALDLYARSRAERELEEIQLEQDGASVYLQTSLLDTRFDDAPARQMVVRDVTAIRNAEREQSRIQRLAELGRVSATLAHEIRNPIGSISLNLELLRNEIELDDDSAETFRDLELGIERLQRVARQILDFVRPETREREPILWPSAVVTMALAHRRACDAAEIELEVESFGEEREALVIVAELEQLVGILIENAAQAQPDGGFVRCRVGSDQRSLWLEVEDGGPGVGEENRERVFDPFYTSKTRGTGLGLSIARRIAEQHSGTLAAETRAEGALLRFRVAVD